MGFLVPDTGLLFWMTLCFGVVLLVLVRYAFPSILRASNGRREQVENSLAAARQTQKALEQAEQDAQTIIRKAHEQSNLIQDQSRLIAKQIEDDARTQASLLSTQALAKAHTQAEEMKRDAMEEVMGQLANITLKVAGKALGEELSAEGRQKQLIEKFLSEQIN